MTAPAPRSTTRIYYTGYPPPALQVAGQVRSATGCTYFARIGERGPTTPFLSAAPPRPVARAPVPAVTDVPSLTLLIRAAKDIEPTDPPFDRLGKMLDIVAARDWYIPALSVVAQVLGLHFRAVTPLLKILRDAGKLTLWEGTGSGPKQLIIRLPSGHEIRSENAPRQLHAPEFGA